MNAGALTVDISGAAAQDNAGNTSQPAVQFSITYDNTAPIVSNVTSLKADGLYGSNTSIDITIEFL